MKQDRLIFNGVRQMQTCRLALGLAKLEILLAKLALRIGIGIGVGVEIVHPALYCSKVNQ